MTPADPSEATTVATPCASPRSYAAAFLVAALGVGLLGWMISTKDGGTVARGAAVERVWRVGDELPARFEKVAAQLRKLGPIEGADQARQAMQLYGSLTANIESAEATTLALRALAGAQARKD